MRPIRIRLLGGLGNQMHCYVAAFVISHETGRPIILDGRWLSWTGSNGNRHCAIQPISVSNSFHPKIVKSLWAIKRGPLRRRFSSLAEKLDNQNFSRSLNSDEYDSVDEFLGILRNSPDIDSLTGYFSSWEWAELAKNFEDYQWNIAGIGKKTREKSSLASKAIGIHIRLGDYLNHPDIYPLASERYYLGAISRLKSKINEPYWIYTDDESNLLRRFPKLVASSQEVFSQRKLNEIDTFYLMSCHKKLVITNSTFSSWAAHKSEFNGNTNVICPTEYLVGDFKDTRPSNWIRMPINP